MKQAAQQARSGARAMAEASRRRHKVAPMRDRRDRRAKDARRSWQRDHGA